MVGEEAGAITVAVIAVVIVAVVATIAAPGSATAPFADIITIAIIVPSSSSKKKKKPSSMSILRNKHWEPSLG